MAKKRTSKKSSRSRAGRSAHAENGDGPRPLLGNIYAVPLGSECYALVKIFFISKSVPGLFGFRVGSEIFVGHPPADAAIISWHRLRVWTGDKMIKNGKWRLIRTSVIDISDMSAATWVEAGYLVKNGVDIRKATVADIDNFGVMGITPPQMVAHKIKRRLASM